MKQKIIRTARVICSFLAVLILALALYSCDQGGGDGNNDEGGPKVPAFLQGTEWENGGGASLLFSTDTVTYKNGAQQSVFGVSGVSKDGSETTVYLSEGRQAAAASNYIRLQGGEVDEVSLAGLDCGGSWRKKEAAAGSVIVYFKKNDGTGSDFSTAKISRGEKVSRPQSDPARQGYDFTGWYREAQCLTLFDFEEAVSDPKAASISVWAGWRLKASEATFEEIFGVRRNTAVSSSYILEGCEIPERQEKGPLAGYDFELPEETVYMLSVTLSGLAENWKGNDLRMRVLRGKNDHRRMTDIFEDKNFYFFPEWDFSLDFAEYDENYYNPNTLGYRYHNFNEMQIFNLSAVYANQSCYGIETLLDGKCRLFVAEYYLNNKYEGFCDFRGHGIEMNTAENPDLLKSTLMSHFHHQIIVDDFEWDAENGRFSWIEVGEESAMPSGRYSYFSNIGF